jgi:hypothetical protein
VHGDAVTPAPLCFFVSRSSSVVTATQHRAEQERPARLANLAVMPLLALIAVAAYLRWQYIAHVQPYPDEFVTLLAVQAILKQGLPVLPSGLFYDHGLLFSYAGAAASALAGFSRETVRAISLGFGIVTVWLMWHFGRRWLSSPAGMIAATIVAVAPSALQWGGRARMYTLLQVWVLLVVGLALCGAVDGQRRWRWLALLGLLAAGLTHFVSLALVPPLVSGVILVGWLAARSNNGRPWWRCQARPPYRLDRRVWLEAAGLVGVVMLSMLVKRLGQPRSIAPLDTSGAGALSGIRQVVEIYASLPTDLSAGWQAVAQFFTAPEALWMSALAAVAVAGAVIGVVRRNPASASGILCPREHRGNLAVLLMAWLIVGTTLDATKNTSSCCCRVWPCWRPMVWCSWDVWRGGRSLPGREHPLAPSPPPKLSGTSQAERGDSPSPLRGEGVGG